MQLYNREDHNAIARNYNAASVKNAIKSAKSRLEAIKSNYEEYIAACEKQLEVIATTEMKPFVYFQRRQNYATKKIELYVGVKFCPVIKDGETLAWTLINTTEKFKGTERKAAREYAEKLAAQYGCEIREEEF